MPVEFCPKCKTVQNMLVTESKRKVKGLKGKKKEIVIRTLHCSVCHAFVRSENVEKK